MSSAAAGLEDLPNDVLLYHIFEHLDVVEEDWVTLMRLRLTCVRFHHLLHHAPCLGDVAGIWERQARAGPQGDKLPKETPLMSERLPWHRVGECLEKVARLGLWEARWLEARFNFQATWYPNKDYHAVHKDARAHRYYWLITGLIQGGHRSEYDALLAQVPATIRNKAYYEKYRKRWQDLALSMDLPWALAPTQYEGEHERFGEKLKHQQVWALMHPSPGISLPRRCLEVYMRTTLSDYEPMRRALAEQQTGEHTADEEIILARRQWFLECQRGSLFHGTGVTHPAIRAWLQERREEATRELERLRRIKRKKRKADASFEESASKKAKTDDVVVLSDTDV